MRSFSRLAPLVLVAASAALVGLALPAPVALLALSPLLLWLPGALLLRRVRAADPICCLLRLDFIESFGGFPESKGGWGYASEVAYHARKQGKKIYVSDRCSVRHSRASGFLVTERGETISKGDEAVRVYSQRYGTAAKIYQGLEAPDFDEAQGLRPSSKT